MRTLLEVSVFKLSLLMVAAVGKAKLLGGWYLFFIFGL